MLEIKHLETLTAIRETGSLQEAAEALHVTQSALSHQLRDLEARLGVKLLNRRTRPARLTTPALRILALADEVLPRIRANEKELYRLAQGDRKSTRMNSSLVAISYNVFCMNILITFLY